MKSDAYSNVSACVLAGGLSSRFPYNKVYLKVNDEFILEKILDTASQLVDDVFIIGSIPYRVDYAVYRDPIDFAGPIGGILGALHYAEKDSVFCFACDMPFITSEKIDSMLQEYEKMNCDVLMPRHEIGIEPLHAIYSKKCLSVIEEQINMGEYAIHKFLEHVNVCYYETSADDPAFRNINTKDDYRTLLYYNNFQ